MRAGPDAPGLERAQRQPVGLFVRGFSLCRLVGGLAMFKPSDNQACDIPQRFFLLTWSQNKHLIWNNVCVTHMYLSLRH